MLEEKTYTYQVHTVLFVTAIITCTTVPRYIQISARMLLLNCFHWKMAYHFQMNQHDSYIQFHYAIIIIVNDSWII